MGEVGQGYGGDGEVVRCLLVDSRRVEVFWEKWRYDGVIILEEVGQREGKEKEGTSSEAKRRQ